MNESNYWFRAQRRAMSRRTVLRGAVVGGLGLTVGADCGGGDDSGSNLDEAPTASAAKQEEVKSILWQRIDTTAQAVKGGIYGSYYPADVTSLDPLSATSYTANYQTAYIYPTLVSWKPGY